MKYRLSAAALFLSLVVAPLAHAADERNVSDGLTAAGKPLAIHGYDAVAYHTDGVAMIGSARHTTVHQEAAYRFVSKANLERFKKDPDRYAPRYGGFCAFGVSVGKKFDGDPRVFEIVDDKLYFNLNPEIQATWVRDIPGNIAKADRNWRTIEHTAAAGL